MAAETVDMTTGGTGGKLPNFRKNGVIQIILDFAAVLAAKGSALTVADVYQVLTVPAGCVIEAACLSPVTDGAVNTLATTVTLDLGDAALGAAGYVDGFDATATTEGVPVMTVEKFYPAADTLDVTLQAYAGTLTSGKVMITAKIYELTVSDLNGTA